MQHSEGVRERHIGIDVSQIRVGFKQKVKNIQQRVFASSHPPDYQPGSTLLKWC